MGGGTPLISVIIPVYNAEKYLERCINSITINTYKNLELICVDDGSNDKSLDILNNLSKNDIRLKIISKENGGVSSARNVGLEYATGDWIAFIDADDYIKIDYFEVLLSAVISNNAGIVACGRIVVKDNQETIQSLLEEDKIYENKEILSLVQTMLGYSEKDMKCWLLNRNFSRGTVVWGQLYKSELIKEIKFKEEVKVAEDMLFNAKAYLNANKVCYLNYCGYYYFQNNESAMSRYFKRDSVWLLQNKKYLAIYREELRQEILKDKQIDIQYMYDGSLVLSACELAVCLSKEKDSISRKLKIYREYMNLENVNNAVRKLKLSNLKFKYKCALFLVKHRYDRLFLSILGLFDKLNISVGL